MKFPKPVSLEEVATFLKALYVGDPGLLITGLNEIHKVEKGDLVFVDHPKYYDDALNSVATFVLINKDVPCPENKGLIVSDDPFRDFNKLISRYHSFPKSNERISNTAIIGEDTIIQPTAFIGHNVTIGKNCLIHANATINNDVIIGDNVIIHSNVCIGSEAFYYKKRDEGYDKLLTCGRVVIEDDVEIGAGSTIDKGVTGNTVIGKGTKLDNLVHIGHDTTIGQNCLFAALVGVSGAVIIEDDVTLWGQVGVKSGITIGKGAVVLGQSGVTKSLEGNVTYFGTPATEAREKLKELAMIRQIPELVKKLY